MLNRSRFIESLIKNGYFLVGQGYYSNVYTKPGLDKVVKVGSGDDWIDFILWGIDNGYAGAFTPMVYSYKYFPEGYFYVAVVERCKAFSECCFNQKHKMDYDMFRNIVSCIRGWGGGIDACPINWQTFVRRFKQFASERSDADDLKEANWLMRPDGSLCLNDPMHGSASRWRGRIKNGKIIEPTKKTSAHDAARLTQRPRFLVDATPNLGDILGRFRNREVKAAIRSDGVFAIPNPLSNNIVVGPTKRRE